MSFSFSQYQKKCLRWTRTSWRSNLVSLFVERRVWTVQPWSTYAIYLSSLVNFALFYNGLMLWTLHQALRDDDGWSVMIGGKHKVMATLVCWILATKLTKSMPHFWLHPRDLVFLPCYIAFGYYHSLLKLWALLTMGEIAWGTRSGVDGVKRSSRWRYCLDL